MKKRNPWSYFLIALAVLLIPVAIIISENIQQEVEVDFETLENAPSPGITTAAPDVAVVSEKEDTYTLGNTVSPGSISKLIDLDYKASFALVVFQGRKPTGGYNVEILNVTHEGNTVNIYVHFTERDPAKPAVEILTSPYHLVKVSREGFKGELVFVVLADGKEILRQTDTVL